jgi:hypothetical protein
MPARTNSSIANSPFLKALQDSLFSDILASYASVAQLVEQVTLNHLVLGSSPSRGKPQLGLKPKAAPTPSGLGSSFES